VAKKRDQWGSSWAFVLAAAGSAVGLGNLWKFPYIAWDNNGGAFVLIYLLCIVLIGLPVMLAEILIGRRAQASPVPAFEKLTDRAIGGRRWAFVGWLGVLGGLVILSFYSVIAGWSLSSFWQCMDWSINGYQQPGEGAFGAFVGRGGLQIFLTLLFSAATALIVMRGISGGIEKATKVLMPVLFLILIALVINSFTLEGAGEALTFLFRPNFSELTTHGVLEALGHSFFTLSLGMGAMITYGSYMGKSESIVRAGGAIVILDTIIALFACLIMYTILFSFPEVQGQMGRSTAGMLFVTLPNMFYTQMPGGPIIGPLFYILVAFAALSSTISLLEVVVSLLVDKMGLTRLKATAAAAGSIFLVSIGCALSLGSVDWLSSFKLFGQSESGFLHQLNVIFFADKAGILNIFDHLASNWILPVGGLLITLYAGWFLNKQVILEELDMVGPDGKPKWTYQALLICLRYIAPAAIAYIIFKVFTGEDFT